LNSLTSNVRRARQVAVRNFCLYRQRTEPRCFVPDINRFARPQPHAAPDILTPAQVGRLLELAGTREATATSRLRPYVLRLALVLLYTAGLRRRELLRLTLADVDAQAGVLRVRESKFHNYAASLAMLDLNGAIRKFQGNKQKMIGIVYMDVRLAFTRGAAGHGEVVPENAVALCLTVSSRSFSRVFRH
jgi:integrase